MSFDSRNNTNPSNQHGSNHVISAGKSTGATLPPKIPSTNSKGKK